MAAEFLSLTIRSKAELNKNDIVAQNHAPNCIYETVEQCQEGKAPKKTYERLSKNQKLNL
ncbi:MULTISPECIES: hypothetical protein [unclassified Bartonella]|uniref:hypothetical protein n=1 Tax=unclassified Bartonella TaxID=2645622 RepID=UPI0035D11352